MIVINVLATIAICAFLILLRIPASDRISLEVWDTSSIRHYSKLIEIIKSRDSQIYRKYGSLQESLSIDFPKTNVPAPSDTNSLKSCQLIEEELKSDTEQFLREHQHDFIPIVVLALPKICIETRHHFHYEVPPQFRCSANWPAGGRLCLLPTTVIHFSDQFCILACMLCRIIGSASCSAGKFPWLTNQMGSACLFISLMCILATRQLSFF